jgi:hypothetical protein
MILLAFSEVESSLLYQDPEASQPETPLTLVYEDVTYVLYSSLTVRQSVEPPDTSDPSSVQIVTESSLDLEGDQKSASCQVCRPTLDFSLAAEDRTFKGNMR